MLICLPLDWIKSLIQNCGKITNKHLRKAGESNNKTIMTNNKVGTLVQVYKWIKNNSNKKSVCFTWKVTEI